MGLVNLPGWLRQTHLQIPESQPTHCTGTAGEVSSDSSFWDSHITVNLLFCCLIVWMTQILVLPLTDQTVSDSSFLNVRVSLFSQLYTTVNFMLINLTKKVEALTLSFMNFHKLLSIDKTSTFWLVPPTHKNLNPAWLKFGWFPYQGLHHIQHVCSCRSVEIPLWAWALVMCAGSPSVSQHSFILGERIKFLGAKSGLCLRQLHVLQQSDPIVYFIYLFLLYFFL